MMSFRINVKTKYSIFHLTTVLDELGWGSAWHHLVWAQKNDRVMKILGTVWAPKAEFAKKQKNKI